MPAERIQLVLRAEAVDDQVGRVRRSVTVVCDAAKADATDMAAEALRRLQA